MEYSRGTRGVLEGFIHGVLAGVLAGVHDIYTSMSTSMPSAHSRRAKGVRLLTGYSRGTRGVLEGHGYSRGTRVREARPPQGSLKNDITRTGRRTLQAPPPARRSPRRVF
jgi:hypothetical protein